MVKINYVCCFCLLLCTSGIAQELKQVAINANFNDQEAPPQNLPSQRVAGDTVLLSTQLTC